MKRPIQVSLPVGPGPTASQVQLDLQQWLSAHGLDDLVQIERADGATSLALGLAPSLHHEAWVQDCDTLGLRQRFNLGDSRDDRLRETVLAMCVSPVVLVFADAQEFYANVRARCNIAWMAAQAQLRFDTEAVDRPTAYWTYDDDKGFVLNPGSALLEALYAALVPDASGHAYSFSCYRASEYVMLYGIAQELQASYPQLYAQLETRWRSAPIASRRFHDVFVHEVGSTDAPLPQRFYIPGDRVWFRNPDEPSADVPGYEGSWVIYMGAGLFSNFWDRSQPFSLEGKCLEIFCWQHAVRRPRQGEPYIDEPLVSELVRGLLKGDPERRAAIVQRMMRYRDVSGTYAEGGCIDSTREFINAFEHGHPVLAF